MKTKTQPQWKVVTVFQSSDVAATLDYWTGTRRWDAFNVVYTESDGFVVILHRRLTLKEPTR